MAGGCDICSHIISDHHKWFDGIVSGFTCVPCLLNGKFHYYLPPDGWRIVYDGEKPIVLNGGPS